MFKKRTNFNIDFRIPLQPDMIDFPNAKINLGLYITSKRKDGYHNLETVMFPVGLTDILEFTESVEDRLNCSGLHTGSAAADNLVMKALQLLRITSDIPPLSIWLHKAIPTGAGLGGGSSDAAFMLKMLNTAYNLGFSVCQLMEYASELGSDCAFFIENRPALATGRGEILNPVNVNLEKFYLVLIHPGFPVSTKEAYSGVIPSKPEKNIAETISLPLREWKSSLYNHFENSVFNIYPEIAGLKEKLYRSGAVFASMSGSGSTVFGLFEEEPVLNTLPQEMIIFKGWPKDRK